MNILLISNNEKIIRSYETILAKFKVPVRGVILEHTADVNSIFSNITDKQVQAIIIDRMELDMDLLKRHFGDVDVFYIVDDWSLIDESRKAPEEYTYRFYLWPVNYALLADDIKSICKFKEYRQLGTIDMGKVFLDLNTHMISNGETAVTLKNKEYELLLYLANNRGRVMTRISILEQVWDMNTQIITNTVDVHVSKIRKILKDHFGITDLIKTIPCCGYQLV